MAITCSVTITCLTLAYLIGVGIYLLAEFIFWDSYLMPSKYTDTHKESVYVKSAEIPNCNIINVLDKGCGIQVKLFKYSLFDRYRIGLFWKNGNSVMATRPRNDCHWLCKWMCVNYNNPNAAKELVERYITPGVMLTDIWQDHNIVIPKFNSLGELSMKLQLGNTDDEKMD